MPCSSALRFVLRPILSPTNREKLRPVALDFFSCLANHSRSLARKKAISEYFASGAIWNLTLARMHLTADPSCTPDLQDRSRNGGFWIRVLNGKIC
jgi:hypothetical protein